MQRFFYECLKEPYCFKEHQSYNTVIKGNKIEAGGMYDLDEFARVEKGVIPSTFEDDIEVVVLASRDTNWDIDIILLFPQPKIQVP